MTPASEEWRPVVGFEGYYEVSNLGRVRSLDRFVNNGSGSFLKPGRVLAGSRDARDGRHRVGLMVDGHLTMRTVAPLVLEAFVGPRPPGMDCLHNNGDATDDRPINLRWGTVSDNLRDSVRHGTHRGASATRCKRGHPLSGPNLWVHDGQRQCRACARAARAVSRALRKGIALDRAAIADQKYAEIVRE